MSEIKLKPCPFCGGEAKLSKFTMRESVKDQHGIFPGKEYPVCRVVCTSCGTRTAQWDSEEEAIAAWNRRDGNE